MCISCAIPVRGIVVGPECLGGMIEDAPPLEQTAPRFSLRADTLAVIGFALVVVVSLFPWSRFASSGFFDAWTVHWSLLAVGAGAAGLLFSLAVRRWPLDPRVEASVYAVLGLLVATGADRRAHV